jgi:dynein heavy chain
MDRRLFKTYCDAWLSPPALAPTFSFNPDNPIARIPNDFIYSIPDVTDLEDYQRFIQSFPDIDSPEVFGLHPNADLTFRVKEAHALINTLLETQPKQSDSGSGRTREDVVMEKSEELLKKLPESFVSDEYKESISKMGGLEVPLNIFLFQEIQRIQAVLEIVKSVLTLTQHAIRGEIVVTPDIVNAINAIYDAKVPSRWMFSSGGDEISWILPALGGWFTGLLERCKQLRTWLDRGRPHTFWLTAFSNPQVCCH